MSPAPDSVSHVIVCWDDAPPTTTTTAGSTTTTTSPPLICQGNCDIGQEQGRCSGPENCLCELESGTAGTCVICPADLICGPVCCPRA